MSGTYVNNDNRSDALNSAAAHDSGLYDPSTHDNQIVALYETMAEANKARDMLVHAGVDSNSIQVMDKSVRPDGWRRGLRGRQPGHVGRTSRACSSRTTRRTPTATPSTPATRWSSSPRRAPPTVRSIIHTLEGTNPIDFDAKLESGASPATTTQGTGSAWRPVPRQHDGEPRRRDPGKLRREPDDGHGQHPGLRRDGQPAQGASATAGRMAGAATPARPAPLASSVRTATDGRRRHHQGDGGAPARRQARGRRRSRARPQLRRRAPSRGAGAPARGAGSASSGTRLTAP